MEHFRPTLVIWPNGTPDHRGRIMFTTVRHDDWCAIFTDRKFCTCRPDISRSLLPRDFGRML